jgi:hypothetical protein
MQYLKLGVATLMAVALFSPSATAQCVGTPAAALTGTWTFSTSGFQFPPTLFLASAGRFTASVGGAGRNILSITATSSIDGNTARYETDAGSFQVLDNCTGGTLTFNLSSRPVQFEFYFVNADEIVLISNSGYRTDIVVGTARRVAAAPVCPAQPLNALVGPWVFSTTGFKFPPTIFLASAGRFVASLGVDRAARPLGVLEISATSSYDGSPTRREGDVGRFQINSTCTGGTLTFNLSSRPVQFDFWFSGPNSIVMIGSNQADIIIGSARRFGSI